MIEAVIANELVCNVLRWLPISLLLEFRHLRLDLPVPVRQHPRLPAYWWEFFCSTSGLMAGRNLCPSSRGERIVPFVRALKTQRCVLSVVVPFT